VHTGHPRKGKGILAKRSKGNAEEYHQIVDGGQDKRCARERAEEPLVGRGVSPGPKECKGDSSARKADPF